MAASLAVQAGARLKSRLGPEPLLVNFDLPAPDHQLLEPHLTVRASTPSPTQKENP